MTLIDSLPTWAYQSMVATAFVFTVWLLLW
jgi:hypothetical protein